MPPSPKSSLPPAVVLGLGSITGLQTARILASHDVPVIGVAKEPNHFARTRVCERVIYSDTTSDEFIGSLVTLGPTLDQKAVLVPCTDLTVLLVSRNRQQLERWYHVVMPEEDVVELLMHKHSFYDWAQKEGFAVPRTLFLQSRADAEHAVETLAFPCIVKPTMKTAAWDDRAGAKAYKVATADEFLALYDRTAPLAKMILAQEWISGRDGALFSCNCYFDADSKPRVTFVARKLRQWPPQTGTSSLGVECRNDAVLDLTVELFERVGLKGLGYLEVKRDDETGEHLIVEPNICRPTVRGPIAEVGGVDLIYSMYCDAVGLPLPPNLEQKYAGAKWIYLEKDILSALQYARRGELSLREWAQSMRGPKSDALISLRDPAPFVLGLFRGARIIANRVTTRQT